MGDGTSGAVGGAASGASMGAAFGPWGALIGGVAGGVAGWVFGNKASKARYAAAMETIRRQRAQQEQTVGQGEAAAGASGIEYGDISDRKAPESSMSMYLAQMRAEFKRQNEWAISQAKEGADLSELANTLGAVSGVGSSLFNFGQANKWWQQPASSGSSTSG